MPGNACSQQTNTEELNSMQDPNSSIIYPLYTKLLEYMKTNIMTCTYIIHICKESRCFELHAKNALNCIETKWHSVTLEAT